MDYHGLSWFYNKKPIHLLSFVRIFHTHPWPWRGPPFPCSGGAGFLTPAGLGELNMACPKDCFRLLHQATFFRSLCLRLKGLCHTQWLGQGHGKIVNNLQNNARQGGYSISSIDRQKPRAYSTKMCSKDAFNKNSPKPLRIFSVFERNNIRLQFCHWCWGLNSYILSGFGESGRYDLQQPGAQRSSINGGTPIAGWFISWNILI